ncbi:pinin-like [Ylistrum balloti]|uniref:pinin-like n=1 Tax=Ylistrum balloti TaxID=509963 RepID=UPI00290583F1|nr:pinin-like [Ylistrum balloti]
MADVRGVSALQDELEKAKESLKDVDDSIKKLTGRDPTEPRPSTRRVTAVADGRGRERLLLQARWGPDEEQQAKRRIAGGAFSRLGPMHRMIGRGRPPRGRDSGDEDDLPNKPTIQSSVVATPKESRTRQSSIEEQSSDRKGTARNRRMFGLLLGTLRKFKDEAKETEDKEVQRKQIEQKLEEKAISEKEDLLRERHQLFLERKQQQAKIRRLEYKMELIEIHDAWEKETRKLEKFIHTKAKPHIFYLPKTMDAVLEGKRKETAKYVDDMIEERRRKLQIEIEDLMAKDLPGGKVDMEGEEDEGAMEGDRNTDKENRRRKSSGERVDLRRQLDQRDKHRGGRDGETPRKRRKSDSVTEEDRHNRAGKHRRRSKEEGDRSGGRRDSHKTGAPRRDDRAKDRAEPRVEISYNDEEEEEEEGELRTESSNNTGSNSMVVKDKRTVEQTDTSVKPDKMDTGETQVEMAKSTKQSRAMMAEDEEEEGEEGEVHDAVDE